MDSSTPERLHHTRPQHEASNDMDEVTTRTSGTRLPQRRIDPYNEQQQSLRSHSSSRHTDRTNSSANDAKAQSHSRSIPSYARNGKHSIRNHHPLHFQTVQQSPYYGGSFPPMHASQDALSQPQGLTSAVLYTLQTQGQKFANTLTGYPKSPKQQENILTKWFTIIIPAMLVVLVSVPIIDYVTAPPEFKWDAERKLNNRQCVLNLFIEKQAPDEFNPDFVEIKPGEKDKDGNLKLPKPPKLEKGTYRTEGQVKVIQRFIGAVADSFLANMNIQQHLLFTGVRDGGHLASIAMKYWPTRGSYRTQVHVIAADDSISSDDSEEALNYGSLAQIESTFQNHANAENIHIYDPKGQKAGIVRSDIDDDDVFRLMEEDMFGSDDDDDDYTKTALSLGDDFVHLSANEYVSFTNLLAPYFAGTASDDDEVDADTEHIIPYFHVDGMRASRQFDILRSSKPLLEDNTIVIVGVEHSPDMDVHELIDFFRDFNYKTFFLGKSQVARIDHLCPEILDQVLSHDSITPSEPSFIRSALQYLNLIPQDPKKHLVHPHQDNQLKYPPFFVAMPRGRRSKEEMTIQHNYDLFGGGGGGGQIKTANDRKAPGKK